MGCAGSKPAEPSDGENENVPDVVSLSRRPIQSTADKTNSELAFEMKDKEINLLGCLENCEVNEEVGSLFYFFSLCLSVANVVSELGFFSVLFAVYCCSSFLVCISLRTPRR